MNEFPSLVTLHVTIYSNSRGISQSPKLCDLMEFFDDEKNWGANEVKSGRSWKLEELRLKSNTDLHKLWYLTSISNSKCTYKRSLQVRASEGEEHVVDNGTRVQQRD